MMMIAEILIITDHSEVLVRKLYRKEALSYDARAIFGKRLQDVRTGKTPPHFEEEGVHMYFIHRGNLYFLASSALDVSTIAITEFLARLYSMTKDLCGVVTEESVRVNFLPIFEMLSAAMDVGVVQVASTERLRPFILSDTVTVGVRPSAQEQITSRLFGIDRHVASASAPQRAAVGSSVHERSLFVDVVENLTIVADSQGKVSHVKVDGRISVRNQLPGSPTLRLALNDDLQICQPGQAKVYGKSAQLDHCKFHADVDTSEFEAKRVIKMAPAVGELSAMVYSVDGSCLLLPVMVRITIQDIDNSRDSGVTMKVTPSFPPTAEAVHVRVTLPLPSSVTSISQRTVGPSESLTFSEKDAAVLWTIRSLTSSQESIAHIRLISHGSQSISSTDIGPAAVEFEVNRLTLSGLFLRSVKILEGSQLCPARRFVRYVTASDSYTVKIP